MYKTIILNKQCINYYLATKSFMVRPNTYPIMNLLELSSLGRNIDHWSLETLA